VTGKEPLRLRRRKRDAQAIQSETPFDEPAHRAWINNVFGSKHALGERGWRIASLDGHRRLRDDGPVNELLINEIHRRAGQAHARVERLLMRF
jgi:hypothetical protein